MTVYYRILDSHWHKDSAIAGAVLASDKHGRVRIVESDTNIAFALLGEDIEKISRVEADDQILAGGVDFGFFGCRSKFWTGAGKSHFVELGRALGRERRRLEVY